MSLPGTFPLPRNHNISEEVKFQRQRILSSEEQLKLPYRGKFNTLTTLNSSSIKPVQRSIGLFFYRRGLKAGFHGSPTLVEFIRTEQVPNWQQYLKNIVLQHPAWLSYPNIKSFELHPRLPICVGFWDGTTSGVAPNANPLQNSGVIGDLLRLTDNPKGLSLTQTQLSNIKSSKAIGPILRMAITVHIRPIGEDSDDEHNNIQLRIKQEDSSSLLDSQSLSTKQNEILTSHRTNSQIPTSISDPTPPILPSQNSANNTTSPTGSTTQEDTPPPSYIPSTQLSSSTHALSAPESTNRFPERPATPTTYCCTRSTFAKKRSLTLFSPEQISIRSPRELKRKSSNQNTIATSESIPVAIIANESSILSNESIESDK